MDDLPRKYVIQESSHRIHNPFTSEQLATLGQALYLPPGTGMLDLACGSGEMLCTWARDHGLTGTGVDISTAFILVGEPYWRREPPDQATIEGCDGIGLQDWLPLPELIESFGLLGCDVVEMVLADQDGWDRYTAASWLNIRRWLDAHPHDELADEMRAELASGPARHARYRREYLGWGVFALMNR